MVYTEERSIDVDRQLGFQHGVDVLVVFAVVQLRVVVKDPVKPSLQTRG